MSVLSAPRIMSQETSDSAEVLMGGRGHSARGDAAAATAVESGCDDEGDDDDA